MSVNRIAGGCEIMTEYACDERTGGMREQNIARKKMKRRKKMNCALCSSKTGKEAVQCVGYAVDCREVVVHAWTKQSNIYQ